MHPRSEYGQKESYNSHTGDRGLIEPREASPWFCGGSFQPFLFLRLARRMTSHCLWINESNVNQYALKALGPCTPVWSFLVLGNKGQRCPSWIKSLKMTYTNIFKASKFIAVHFLIAFTMEILIVQIFILDFVAFEITKLLISFAIINEDLYYSIHIIFRI